MPSVAAFDNGPCGEFAWRILGLKLEEIDASGCLNCDSWESEVGRNTNQFRLSA